MAESNEAIVAEAAERYAQAAFDLAQESNALAQLEADFAKLDEAWAASADLRDVAGSPLIDPEEKARAFVAVADKLGLSTLARNLIGVVARNRRAAELPSISRSFRRRLAQHRGARQAEIISARPLADAERDEIIATVGKSLGVKIEAQTKVDDRLIGGFIVRVGSRQFDASLRSKLDSLKLALKSA
ncbi:MAG: F0F1 ATP synthase subunit delta [Hyphomonadaceae bacterium]|nr:F0F1 ATP synthase subunit delta [Hyphomonadaceae bacterium]